MELVFPVALGFAFINFIPPEQKHFRVTPDGASVVRRRWKKREFTSNDFAKGFCFCFLALGMLVAVGLARSRGGLLVTAWGLVLFGLLFMYLRRGQGTSLAVIIVLVALLVTLSLGTIVYLGWEEALVREARQIDLMRFGEEKRFYLWHDVWKGIQEFPLWGAGWGTFGTIFPYQRTMPGERSIAEHAESDILEIGLEGGLAALGLLGWAVAAVAMRSKVRLSPLHAGLGVGLANVLFHSVFDFPLRIPAVSFVFSVSAALSASLGRVQEE
jgi:O-antigen ligase